MHARRVRLRADELSHVPLALRLVVGQQKVPELVAETAERGYDALKLCLNSPFPLQVPPPVASLRHRKRSPSPSGKISKFARHPTSLRDRVYRCNHIVSSLNIQIKHASLRVWAKKKMLTSQYVSRNSEIIVFYFSLAIVNFSCTSRNIMISLALLLVSSPILNSLRSLRKEAAIASPVCSALSFSCRSLAICAEKHAWPRAFGAFYQQGGRTR